MSFEIRTFAPSWGAAVMGTSVVAVATAAAQWPVLLPRTLLVLASVAAVLVIGITITRWLRHRDEAKADLRHPVKGGMTATLAGAMLAWAVAIARVGTGWLPDDAVTGLVTTLTVVGALLALAISWEFLANAFTSDATPLEQVSGAWFIPPVVTIIVPLALSPLALEWPQAQNTLLGLAWAFLGVGLMLYLAIVALLFLRTVAHPLPPAMLAPTLIIGMGPPGLMALDVLRLAEVSGGTALVGLYLPAATMLWGFGFWWLVASLIVLRRGYARLDFTLSWWGFVFPFGAWTVASSVLAAAYDSSVFTVIAQVATAALLVLWLMVTVRTLAGMRSGTIWSH